MPIQRIGIYAGLILLLSFIALQAQPTKFGGSGGSGTAIEGQDEGSGQGTISSAINAVGAGITATYSAGVWTITVPGAAGGTAYADSVVHDGIRTPGDSLITDAEGAARYQALHAFLTAIAGLGDPGADRFIMWDDSDAGSEISWGGFDALFSISGTTIGIDTTTYVATLADSLDWILTQYSASQTYITATLTQEQVEDYAGAMVTGNTETLITVTYQVADNTFDFVVDNDLNNYSNATSKFYSHSDTTSTLATQADTLDYMFTQYDAVFGYQPLDVAELSSIAGLTSAADRGIYYTGSGTASLFTLTATGRSIVDDASVGAVMTTLGMTANGQSTVTAANYAAMKTLWSLDNVENTAISTWAGSANITTLGTISTGTVPYANLSFSNNIVAGDIGTGAIGTLELGVSAVHEVDMNWADQDTDSTFSATSPNLIHDTITYTIGDTCKAADLFKVKAFAYPVTIDSVVAVTDAGTHTFNIEHRAQTTQRSAGTDVLTSDIAADAYERSSTFSDATIPANRPLFHVASATSGADYCYVTIYYKYDQP